jgi:hypothetical protein
MLYREKIAVCSEIHTKHINTLCGQNVEFVNVKSGGTYSNHWALKRIFYPDYVLHENKLVLFSTVIITKNIYNYGQPSFIIS